MWPAVKSGRRGGWTVGSCPSGSLELAHGDRDGALVTPAVWTPSVSQNSSDVVFHLCLVSVVVFEEGIL